jgi:hypothetical protein
VAEYFSTVEMPWLNVRELTARIQQDYAAGIRNPRLTFAVILLAEWHRSFVERRTALRRSYESALN